MVVECACSLLLAYGIPNLPNIFLVRIKIYLFLVVYFYGLKEEVVNDASKAWK